MIDDPYKILEVPKDATKEEIKKAYRRKAKEYHPDLHPDDPDAAKKMNEINEAYDMLNNPQKYERKNTSGNQRTYGNSYGQTGWNGTGYGSQDSRGGYGDFGEFSFEDIFGFGRYAGNERPNVQPQDSQDIRQSIDFINMGQYGYAKKTLDSIPGRERNARWYYLSALANQGLGNSMMALEQIERAIQMEPENTEYRNVRNNLHSTESVYQEAGKEFQKYAEGAGKFCMGFFAMQFLSIFCCR